MTRDDFSSLPPFLMLDISRSNFGPEEVLSIEVIKVAIWDGGWEMERCSKMRLNYVNPCCKLLQPDFPFQVWIGEIGKKESSILTILTCVFHTGENLRNVMKSLSNLKGPHFRITVSHFLRPFLVTLWHFDAVFTPRLLWFRPRELGGALQIIPQFLDEVSEMKIQSLSDIVTSILRHVYRILWLFSQFPKPISVL